MPPAKAESAPQTRFWIAIANENTSRPQPKSRLIGCRKRPKPARAPKLKPRIRQPQTMTTVGFNLPLGGRGEAGVGERVFGHGQGADPDFSQRFFTLGRVQARIRLRSAPIASGR